MRPSADSSSPETAAHVSPVGRIHIAARRRGADALAIGSLALHLPHAAASLFVVAVLAYALQSATGIPVYATVAAWLLSGALVFHRPTEAFLAHHVFGHRPPSLVETGQLDPVWRDVTARFGADAATYQLWIAESEELNAEAAAGHIVTVTSAALRLPPDQLAAVLAHELSHHVAGHSWSALLSSWYALPGRLLWRLLRAIHRFTLPHRPTQAREANRRLILLASLAALMLVYLFPWLLLLALTPWLLAAVSRRAELSADRAAALRGFGPQLVAVLQRFITDEEASKPPDPVHRHGRLLPAPSLLSAKPDHHTRLQRLQRQLQQPGH
ncbi:M48 family metalloprotease [Streptomyces venezuelae]|uniref:M48 family metalloprotease n=1 Tax=Streptomyces venezuelae TaxID=54571 RepID=UPI003648672A